MRTNPLLDAWSFIIGETPDQLSRGEWRWLLVALFLALLLAGIVIAVRNWRENPEQRTPAHLVMCFARMLIGCMWFQGTLWKLPFFTTENGLYFWTKQMVENSAFDWHRALVEHVLLPAFIILDPIVYLAELTFAVSLMLGLGVRLVGVLAIVFVLNLWIGLYRHPAEWPWNYLFLAFLMGAFSLHAAGRSLGLDAMLRRRAALNGELPAPVRRLIALAA